MRILITGILLILSISTFAQEVCTISSYEGASSNKVLVARCTEDKIDGLSVTLERARDLPLKNGAKSKSILIKKLLTKGYNMVSENTFIKN